MVVILTTNCSQYFAKLQIEGKKACRQINALVDTGASITFVDSETCEELGFEVGGSRDVRIASGETKNFTAWVGKVAIDRYSNENHTMLAIKNPPESKKNKIEGLLGTDIMRNFKLFIDWENKTGSLN